jgi:pimeloyl-ACP methyl ester carboxylesterase
MLADSLATLKFKPIFRTRHPAISDRRSLHEAETKERVILVHGWMGLPSELFKLGRAFKTAGFDVEHVRHYSMLGRFEAAVDATLEKLLADPARPAHLVGFSLGGLIVRATAAACPDRVSSLLLIGTPNTGSPFADLLSLVNPTPSVLRLRCAAPKLPEPPRHIRVGCIAGTRAALLGSLLDGPNDSRVTVESAFAIRHDYEALVHCKHEVLRAHPDVLRHAVAFVRDQSRNASAPAIRATGQ